VNLRSSRLGKARHLPDCRRQAPGKSAAASTGVGRQRDLPPWLTVAAHGLTWKTIHQELPLQIDRCFVQLTMARFKMFGRGVSLQIAIMGACEMALLRKLLSLFLAILL
jgi:hypothetical protein